MRPHRVDMVSLIFGLLFLLIAAWWLLAGPLGLGIGALGWAVALVLIVIGTLGLLSALRSTRSRDGEEADRR